LPVWRAADPPVSPAGNGPGWLAPERSVAAPPSPPVTVAGAEPPSGHRRARPARLGLVIAALVGVAGLAVSLTGLAGQVLPRRFSAAEQQKTMAWEVASRWRTWPAGKIFPASVGSG